MGLKLNDILNLATNCSERSMTTLGFDNSYFITKTQALIDTFYNTPK